jgi:hypothetical protein
MLLATAPRPLGDAFPPLFDAIGSSTVWAGQLELGVLRVAQGSSPAIANCTKSAGRMWMRASALLPWFCVATGVGSALGPGLTCHPA